MRCPGHRCPNSKVARLRQTRRRRRFSYEGQRGARRPSARRIAASAPPCERPLTTIRTTSAHPPSPQPRSHGDARKPCTTFFASVKDPAIWPVALMPYGLVPPPAAPGTSIVVNVPPESRKPCNPVASTYDPTIWPTALMPYAEVVPAAAPGTSIGETVPPDNRKPCDPAAS